MKTTEAKDLVTAEQVPCVIPNLTIKDLLSAIPQHCFQRSALKSGSYIVWDFFLIGVLYKTASFLDSFNTPDVVTSPVVRSLSHFSIWALYSFGAGLVMTGLWIVAHECGHRAFSENNLINDTVGWFLHSGLGVPYHSWRISHGKHHASTSHMTNEQAFVPRTRSEQGIPAFKAEGETLEGSSVTKAVIKELREAIDDSPLMILSGLVKYLLVGWPAYLLFNAAGQRKYPTGTNHFNPNSSVFGPHQRNQIILSDIGVALWLSLIIYCSSIFGFATVFRVYLAPYLWVNHWIVMLTFLQHTDPLLPHYRASEFTFPRGALATFDRSLMGDLGSVMAWIGATTTHGICETHVLHHVCSKIPHYNAWEATDALRKRLAQSGIHLQGRPVGWTEMYRVYKECRFVEDEGDILFYKNANGLAAARPVFSSAGADGSASDSGIEVDCDGAHKRD